MAISRGGLSAGSRGKNERRRHRREHELRNAGWCCSIGRVQRASCSVFVLQIRDVLVEKVNAWRGRPTWTCCLDHLFWAMRSGITGHTSARMPARKEPQPPLDPLFLAVGHRVIALREQRGLIQAQLAELASMDPNYLWRIEAGRQNLSLRNVARLAKALGVTLSVMLEGIDVEDIEVAKRPYGKRGGEA